MLAEELADVWSNPVIVDEPTAATPDQFGKFLRQEQMRWRKVVADSKFEKQ